MKTGFIVYIMLFILLAKHAGMIQGQYWQYLFFCEVEEIIFN